MNLKEVKTNAIKLLNYMDANINRIFDISIRSFYDSSWKNEIQSIIEDCETKPEIEVAFIGESGVGKTSLINSVLGNKILPAGGIGKACTASIAEISWSEDSKYHTSVEFMSKEEWLTEIKKKLMEITSLKQNEESEILKFNLNELVNEMPEGDREKFTLIYSDLNIEFSDINHVTENLKEKESVIECFKSGRYNFETDNIEKLTEYIANYLNSQNDYWPIVKKVSISGPFPILKNGLKLIDLPGWNDPNEAREKILRDFIINARFMVMSFGIKRGLRQYDINFLESESFKNFFKQLMIDNRDNRLTFALTNSDNIDVDEIAQHSGKKEIDFDEAVEIRNLTALENFTKKIKQVLEKILPGDEEKKKTMIDSIANSKKVIVSPKDYFIHESKSKRARQVFSHIDQTGIPELKQHLEKISSDYNAIAKGKSLKAQLYNIINDIKNRLAISISRKKERRDKVSLGSTEIAPENDEKYYNFKIKLESALQPHKNDFINKAAKGFETIEANIESTINDWQGIHHGVLKCIVARNGDYTNTKGSYNFPACISGPATDSMLIPWNDFHYKIVEELKANIINLQTFSNEFFQNIRKSFNEEQKLFDEHERIFQNKIQSIINKVQNSLLITLGEIQRHFIVKVEEWVKRQLEPVFNKLKSVSGTGMKKRILNALESEVKSISADMVNKLNDVVYKLVDYILDEVMSKSNEIIDQVRDCLLKSADAIYSSPEASRADDKEIEAATCFIEQLQKISSFDENQRSDEK